MWFSKKILKRLSQTILVVFIYHAIFIYNLYIVSYSMYFDTCIAQNFQIVQQCKESVRKKSLSQPQKTSKDVLCCP